MSSWRKETLWFPINVSIRLMKTMWGTQTLTLPLGHHKVTYTHTDFMWQGFSRGQFPSLRRDEFWPPCETQQVSGFGLAFISCCPTLLLIGKKYFPPNWEGNANKSPVMGPETMDTIWNIKGALWISENIIFHCEVVQAHCAVLLLRDSKNYGCVPDQFAVGGPSWSEVAGPDGLQRSLLTSTILQICVWEESIQQNINKDTRKP